MHHIVIPLFHRHGPELGGVEARSRFGYRKTRLLPPFDQGLQHPCFLLSRSEFHDRIEPENVHVDGGSGAGAAARFCDRLHHDRRFCDPQSRAADRLGHRDPQPTALRHGQVQIVRKASLAVPFKPVLVVETRANPQNTFADFALLLRHPECHVRSSSRAVSIHPVLARSAICTSS